MTASIDPARSPSPSTNTNTTGKPAHTSGGSRLRDLAVHTTGLARPLAGNRWFRLWAVLHHVGRTSGRAYAIPVVAFAIPDGFLIPLPFGDQTQWLKNLQSAETGGLRHAGHDYVIDQPEVVGLDLAGADLPAPIRFASGRLGIDHFVRVHLVA